MVQFPPLGPKREQTGRRSRSGRGLQTHATDKIQSASWWLLRLRQYISLSVWESRASSAVRALSSSPRLSNFGKLQICGTGTGKKMLHHGGKQPVKSQKATESLYVLFFLFYFFYFFRGLWSHCRLSARQQVSGDEGVEIKMG